MKNMNINKFELRLDESGSFENDIESAKRGFAPSMVGGILYPEGTLDGKVKEILGTDDLAHGCEEDSYSVWERFVRISAEKVQFVVFSNEQRLVIMDNVATYLNVMAEGLSQLIHRLKAHYQNVHLNIVLASRPDFRVEGNPLVRDKEYKYRIQERLILAGADGQISPDEWSLTVDSARHNKELMLADTVCNTFFMRKMKFRPDQRSFIENIYTDSSRTLYFSLFEAAIRRKYTNDIIEGRIGEAVSILCETNDKDFFTQEIQAAASCFKQLSEQQTILQYRIMSALLENRLAVERDFITTEQFCNNLLNGFFPIVIKDCEGSIQKIIRALQFDVRFYLLTAYTHQGNTKKEEELIEQCDREIFDIPNDIKNYEYRLKYLNRRIIHFENSFDFSAALVDCDDLIARCESLKAALQLVEDEGTDEIKSAQLAMALGTRARIYTFLARSKKECISIARTDNDKSIQEFIRETDKLRQYQLRAQIESEAGAFDTALHYLYLSEGISNDNLIDYVKSIANHKFNPFSISSCIRLLGESKMKGWTKADSIYKQLEVVGIIELLNGEIPKDHPWEISTWKLATYRFYSGQTNAALKLYEKAIQSCNYNLEQHTIRAIGIGIELERYSFLLEKKAAKEYLGPLKKNIIKFCEDAPTASMKQLFSGIDFSEQNPEYFFNLSRKIPY